MLKLHTIQEITPEICSINKNKRETATSQHFHRSGGAHAVGHERARKPYAHTAPESDEHVNVTMVEDCERSTETVTVVTTNFPTSSLKSEDSTEQLICKTPQKPKKSVSSKSVEAGSDDGGSKWLVVFLGLSQVVLGTLLIGGGAFAVVKGAALSRVGAGLWSGCIAVVAGVVGVLAGINDCYGLNNGSSSPLLTAFLALSLLCLACGNSAAVLAATGLHRDSQRQPLELATFEDEMQAWTPVLTNISLLIIATIHCVVCLISIYHLSKRICPCFRPKQAFDHNQFDPTFKALQPCVFHVDEIKKAQQKEMMKGHELCKDLEMKLHVDTMKKKKKKDEPDYGSANSKERLVTRWLGHHHAVVPAGTVTRARRPTGVRKTRKPPPGPLMLVPAHPASTLGRMPVPVMLPPPRYATLPLPPAHYPHPLYYPMPDNQRMRRRRSPRPLRSERAERRGRGRRERATQLTRSLERIHRRRRADHEQPTVDDLKRTYTGLDRAYAEQFIAVCDESRQQHDSLVSTATDSTDSRH